jgi:hypothetical protein
MSSVPIVKQTSAVFNVLDLKQALVQMEVLKSEIENFKTELSDLHVKNSCHDKLEKIDRRLQKIENKNVNTVTWTIKNVNLHFLRFPKLIDL